MPANKFVLRGSDIEIAYLIGADPSLPALIYKSGLTVKQFKPDEIRTDGTGMGQMVSVALSLTVDVGAEWFAFFIPKVEPPRGQTVDFNTFGAYETFAGPNTFPHRAPTWSCIDLRGTAQTVIVPSAEPVRA